MIQAGWHSYCSNPSSCLTGVAVQKERFRYGERSNSVVISIELYLKEIKLLNLKILTLMKTIELKIPSRLDSLESIEKALDYLKGEYDKISGGKKFPLNEVKIATFEAFSNAVKHAHLNRPELEVIIQLTLEAQKFEVQVFDCGKGFDFEKMKVLSQARGALLNYTLQPTSLSKIGFGIFIITSLMDQVRYIPAVEGSLYNRLIMVKYLSEVSFPELKVKN